MSDKNHPKWLKSGRVDFANTSKIDADNGILYGVIMCQVGAAKGHGVFLEQEFIEDGINYANQHHANRGLKARFGHPGMSNETLGTEMGRFKNFRVVDDKMVADLHLFKSANLSPTQPGMRDWMLSMAQEDPHAIMCSIVFNVANYYQRASDGKKYTIVYKSSEYGGYWESEDKKYKYEPDGKKYVALKELLFCDIVDEGAATDKLFSAEINADKFAVIATDFLNEYPQIDQFVQANPAKLVQFLTQRYGIEMAGSKPGIIEQFISLFKPKEQNQTTFFYMSKIQLGLLTALSVKLAEQTATPADYAAATQELQEQGVNVVVLNAHQHAEQVKSLAQAKKSLSEAVLSLRPEATAEEAAQVNLQEAIAAKLAEKDAAIAALTKQLAEAGKPENPIRNNPEELSEEEEAEAFETSADVKLKELRKKFGQ